MAGPGNLWGPMDIFGIWKTHRESPIKSQCLVTKHPFIRRQVDNIALTERFPGSLLSAPDIRY